jgi:hypothetical protein
MEEVADLMVRYLYDHFLIKGTTQRSCVLVRLFVTQPFSVLNAELQARARELLGNIKESPAHKCLLLLGTVGQEAEWNSRYLSRGHQVIPLPASKF